MTHSMKLNPAPFEAVKAGYKSIELRLYDAKRRAVHPGDEIVFTKIGSPEETVTRRVEALHVFDSFAALYGALPLLKCGYTPFTVYDADPAETEAFYPKEMQAQNQVVGIALEEEPFQKYLAAQTGAMADCSSYETALAEIRAGYKATHWIWYIFPLVGGIMSNVVTEYYALSGVQEARAYLAHPLLGARLREITNALLALEKDDPAVIFGVGDAFKLRACMTLFDAAAPEERIFRRVLDQYCAGMTDADTLAHL